MIKPKTKYVSIATQKGGSGKSTFTMLIASMLQYSMGKNVAVIDCDGRQGTISEMRDRDLEMIGKNPKFASLFKRVMNELGEKPIYPVKRVGKLRTADGDLIAIDVADKLSVQAQLDYVFFDIPGSVDYDGVLSTISWMDYVFCPFMPVRADADSSFKFCSTIQSGIINEKHGNLKAIYGFWTAVNKTEKTPVIDIYNEVAAASGINMLKTQIPQQARFKKELSDNPSEIFKSTIFPPRPAVRWNTGMDELIDEMILVMN
jgi:cellulose biosynthesis protein BcsQ